jgi:hypothetical protein
LACVVAEVGAGAIALSSTFGAAAAISGGTFSATCGGVRGGNGSPVTTAGADTAPAPPPAARGKSSGWRLGGPREGSRPIGSAVRGVGSLAAPPSASPGSTRSSTISHPFRIDASRLRPDPQKKARTGQERQHHVGELLAPARAAKLA